VSYPIPNPENGLSMAQRAAEQPCHPFANCTGFGVLAFELHDTGPIVKTARIFHQTPQSPHNLRQTSMYRHYDNTMPSHDYLKKHITLQLSHCTLVVIVIIPSIPGTCHQPKIAGPVSHLNLPRHLLTGGFDHRISGALGAHVFANPWDYRMASYLYSIC
jgi:hypothetical protein